MIECNSMDLTWLDPPDYLCLESELSRYSVKCDTPHTITNYNQPYEQDIQKTTFLDCPSSLIQKNQLDPDIPSHFTRLNMESHTPISSPSLLVVGYSPSSFDANVYYDNWPNLESNAPIDHNNSSETLHHHLHHNHNMKNMNDTGKNRMAIRQYYQNQDTIPPSHWQETRKATPEQVESLPEKPRFMRRTRRRTPWQPKKMRKMTNNLTQNQDDTQFPQKIDSKFTKNSNSINKCNVIQRTEDSDLTTNNTDDDGAGNSTLNIAYTISSNNTPTRLQMTNIHAMEVAQIPVLGSIWKRTSLATQVLENLGIASYFSLSHTNTTTL